MSEGVARKDRKEPKYWMRRAEQARVEAALVPDIRTRSVLVGFATAYELLAERIEKLPPNPRMRLNRRERRALRPR